MTNFFVSKPRRRADRVAHRKLANMHLGSLFYPNYDEAARACKDPQTCHYYSR